MNLNRYLMIFAAIFAIGLTACGGGDKAKSPAAEPTDRPEATADAPADDADDSSEDDADDADDTDANDTDANDSDDDADVDDDDGSSSRSGAISDLFGSVFSNGFSGGGAAAGLGGGDESLLELLPETSDFPSGYTSLGEMTFSAPAGSSELGAVDMAMAMAMKGDFADLAGATDPSEVDFSSIEMMVAMVMRPEDLQALGDAFGEIENLDEDEIQDEINRSLGGMEGFEVERFEVLDASGLGDGGFGMEMTIDMSGFAGLFGALGGEDAPTFEAMTMRMYIFGRGDYVGAVMRIGFSDSLGGDGDDLDLAEIIDANLTDAPGT